MNEIIVKVLTLWLESMKNSPDTFKWVTENQMWIYPLDGNYVVYSKPQEDRKFSIDLFLSDEGITISFTCLESVENFVKNPVILL